MLIPNLPDPIADEVSEASQGRKGCLWIIFLLAGILLVVLGILSGVYGYSSGDAAFAYIATIFGILLIVVGLLIFFKSQTQPIAVPHQPEANTTFDKLNELQEMLADGMISEAEFEAKRQDLLDRM